VNPPPPVQRPLKKRSILFCGCVTALTVLLVVFSALGASAGDALVGQPAKGWVVEHWFNSGPLTLPELRGDVVLVRWWTAPGCQYCAATAPALNEFHETFRGRGLRVIGFYHHKSPGPLRVEAVREAVRKFGFQFPVAIDPQWRTLKAWWLDQGDRDFTSVSFLIDRRGIIRHVHPGGQFVKGDPDYEALRAAIEGLLAENAGPPAPPAPKPSPAIRAPVSGRTNAGAPASRSGR
jgi:peroxiredoxin